MFLNLKLLSQPLNWATLAVWIILAGFAIHHLDPHLPSTDKGN